MKCSNELIHKASIALYDRDLDKGETLNPAMWQYLYECLRYFRVEGVQGHVDNLNFKSRQVVESVNKRRVKGNEMAVSNIELHSFDEWLETFKLLKNFPGTEAFIKQVVIARLIDFDNLEAAIEFNKSSAEMRAQLLSLIE